ncbi:MAG: histidine phosphatase family protein [Methyloligellaceae bacterium]
MVHSFKRLLISNKRTVIARLHFMIFCACLISINGAFAASENLYTDQKLLTELRRGGFNLYIRHVATNWSQSDKIQKHGDWTSCDPAKVRQLSDTGRKASASIGAAIKSLGIRIGAIFSSPYCRTIETARLMELGVKVEVTNDLMNLRTVDYVGGQKRVVEMARKRLSSPPEPATNTLYSAHGNLASAATEFYPEEGEILVFKPASPDGFTLVGRIPVEKWQKLQSLSVK